MAQSKRQIKLGAFLHETGHHVAAWRLPEAQADGGANFAHYVELARIAERGRFDMLFLADSVGIWHGHEEALNRTARVAHFEPLTLLSALAAVTSHIGFVATATTTYNEPYHVARKFASLDLISGGRAGWNLVTSSNAQEAFNFSRDAHLAHADRYVRAREFARVVQGLWDSWDDDAFVRDKESGIFFKSEGLHVLNHVGPAFQVRGPLNVPRSPQGQPVLVQAGSSEAGRGLAAATAEAIFTAHQTLAEAQAFYSDVKAKAVANGRHPDDVKIMPGIFPVIGETKLEAEEKFERLQDLVHPDVGLSLLSSMIGLDLRGQDVDGPLPPIPESETGKSRARLLSDLAERESLSIRQLYQHIAGARGHKQIVGTPAEIADHLEEWFIQGAADGFNVMPPHLPGGLVEFVDLVIPELQRRGLFRREYEGKTLRENLGLSRPENRFADGTHTRASAAD
ncbi:LLM class flavin-dependent oxidoreductase [Acidisoma silvae]|uniref:LLM class flavin-dependent oxidoreductase n=1 Tax=Acidisoma silvae TaxID=2802396 RepID=A0A963YVR5_9PROT|nr:LLM class flavin-dependent oxidoreductase [Acidisoma silvae]MCB8878016.1 LLM class flavin-dependent oxidoreductase [Acidisoma silvae]